MVRTAIGLLLVFISIFWLPWWVSIGVFLLGLIFAPYSIVFLIPAFFADMTYAAHTENFFTNYKIVAWVLVALLIKYLLLTKTRVRHIYDPSTS